MKSLMFGLVAFLLFCMIGNAVASSEERTFADVKSFMESTLVESFSSVDLAVLTLEDSQLTFSIHPAGDTKDAIRSAVRDAIWTYQTAIAGFDKGPAHDALIPKMRIIITEKDGKRLGSTTCACALIWRGQDIEPVTDTVMKSFEAMK